jgi:hypothetical protein
MMTRKVNIEAFKNRINQPDTDSLMILIIVSSTSRATPSNLGALNIARRETSHYTEGTMSYGFPCR